MRRRHLPAFAALLPVAARAQNYPERPITMIVAFSAGGGTDTAARTLARFLERSLGQPVLVINRGGAGGEIGWSELARATPDGHTIGFINTPNLLTIPIERRANYRPDQFAPVANLVDDPGGAWVLTDSPIRDVAGLVAEARRRPGEVAYGTTGVGSDDHLAMLGLERITGTRFLHVPFAGSSPVRTALLGKQLAVAIVNMGEGMGDWRQGVMRPLGAMATARWEGAPEVATFREQGFELVAGSLRGLGAPAGVPRAVLDRLAAAVQATIRDPEFLAAAAQQSLPLRFLGPDDYRAELARLDAEYRELWARHPWKE